MNFYVISFFCFISCTFQESNFTVTNALNPPCFEYETYYTGSNIYPYGIICDSAAHCQKQCEIKFTCEYWSYYSGVCYLKYEKGDAITGYQVTSGAKLCTCHY